jgi:hypothetical protein
MPNPPKEKILVVDASDPYAMGSTPMARSDARRPSGASAAWTKRSDDHA